MQRRPFGSFPSARSGGSGGNGEGRPVLAIGARALVTGRPGSTTVPLSDENGIPSGMSMAAEIEVEIVAWRPRGANGTRYRVRNTTDGTEGWLDAASVRGRPAPPKAAPRPTRLPPAPAPKAAVSARPRKPAR